MKKGFGKFPTAEQQKTSHGYFFGEKIDFRRKSVRSS